MRDLSFTALAIDQIAFIVGVTVTGALAMFAAVAGSKSWQRRRAARFLARARARQARHIARPPSQSIVRPLK